MKDGFQKGTLINVLGPKAEPMNRSRMSSSSAKRDSQSGRLGSERKHPSHNSSFAVASLRDPLQELPSSTTRMTIYATVATALLLLSALRSVVATHEHPEVNSTSGLIVGHRAQNRTKTFEFLGIKYGQAPVESLRFAAPIRYVAPAGTVYNASSWHANCPANIPPESKYPNFTGEGFAIYNQFTAHLGDPQSEDCLALNIWTKTASDVGASNKPVFVFFHGGRFTIPGPHSPFYNGQYLADTEDVVVVTVNYRLGIFGFPGAPGLEQNAGLRDQRSAVEWVRDNIAGFGGDCERIIILGQSAGASSVDYYAYAHQDDPIVAGLISHSGTAFSFIPNDVSYSQSLFYNVSATLGCGDSTADSAVVVECVRRKNTTDVLAAARFAPALPTTALAQATFHPTVDNVTVFSDYVPLAKSGAFAKIPYLAGNCNYEAGFYRVGAYAANITLTPAQWQLFNQRAFTCPTKYATDARAQHGVPTWRYRYMADWKNLRLYPASRDYPDSGTYHGSDMDMLFGTAYDVTGRRNSLQEELTSRYFMGAWAAFGRDPTAGLEVYGWPMSRSNTSSLVQLAYDNQAIPSIVSPDLYDSSCPPVDENNPLPGRGAF
ncbi:hypothetical protein LTR35_016461 [Friedmanniomyces endolithicus]|nr:hypothetical protein LTR35_016461 [Friedmanniomyces endolithicus]KAK0978157.1 hypothetical protein LTR54_015969 [Friedmanniomyces endolithicus]